MLQVKLYSMELKMQPLDLVKIKVEPMESENEGEDVCGVYNIGYKRAVDIELDETGKIYFKFDI